MGRDSKIEWTDHTFNPWIGCERISPACDRCYAATSTATRSTQARTGKQLWAGDRHRTANWTAPLRLDREARAAGKRTRIFCASLADVFDNAVPAEWRRDLFALIAQTTNTDWLLLTKRIGNARKMMNDAVAELAHGINDWDDMPWPNVWLGATVVTQAEADRDIPKLLATPARGRFLSIEPMLGPINLLNWIGTLQQNVIARRLAGLGYERQMLDWIIVGGESQTGARPMHPDWVRGMRDQCRAFDVPFLFKQWGEWLPGDQAEAAAFNGDGASIHEWNDAAETFSIHLPKKHAGRVLDGRTHDDFPQRMTGR